MCKRTGPRLQSANQSIDPSHWIVEIELAILFRQPRGFGGQGLILMQSHVQAFLEAVFRCEEGHGFEGGLDADLAES